MLFHLRMLANLLNIRNDNVLKINVTSKYIFEKNVFKIKSLYAQRKIY